MSKKTNLLVMIFLLPFIAFSQQKQSKSLKNNGYLKFGVGLYSDVSNSWLGYYPDRDVPTVNGQQIWAEGGIILHNGLVVSAGIMHVTLDRSVFGLNNNAGWQIKYSIRNYSLGLGYEFKLGKHSRLMPVLAFVVHWSGVLRVYYYGKYDNLGNQTLNSEIYDDNNTEASAVFNIDYYYQFKCHLFLGARAGIYYIHSIDVITATPIVGFKF